MIEIFSNRNLGDLQRAANDWFDDNKNILILGHELVQTDIVKLDKKVYGYALSVLYVESDIPTNEMVNIISEKPKKLGDFMNVIITTVAETNEDLQKLCREYNIQKEELQEIYYWFGDSFDLDWWSARR